MFPRRGGMLLLICHARFASTDTRIESLYVYSDVNNVVVGRYNGWSILWAMRVRPCVCVCVCVCVYKPNPSLPALNLLALNLYLSLTCAVVCLPFIIPRGGACVWFHGSLTGCSPYTRTRLPVRQPSSPSRFSPLSIPWAWWRPPRPGRVRGTAQPACRGGSHAAAVACHAIHRARPTLTQRVDSLQTLFLLLLLLHYCSIRITITIVIYDSWCIYLSVIILSIVFF